jgi:hypothetical protein
MKSLFVTNGLHYLNGFIEIGGSERENKVVKVELYSSPPQSDP